MSLLETQAALYGRFDASILQRQWDGSILTGSAEQGFLAHFRAHGIDGGEVGQKFYCHNQCFRNEQIFDEDRRFEFDKIEYCQILSKDDSVSGVFNDVLHFVRKTSQDIFQVMGGPFTSPKVRFEIEPRRVLVPLKKGGHLIMQDINLHMGDERMETHTVVLYDTNLTTLFSIDAPSGTKLLFATVAAFPRFLKPYTITRHIS